MNRYGFDEGEARKFLERELGRSESSTTFYWESEELEEAIDLMVDAVAKLLAANNKKIADDWSRHGAKDLRVDRY